jgi:hypothetical protein
MYKRAVISGYYRYLSYPRNVEEFIENISAQASLFHLDNIGKSVHERVPLFKAFHRSDTIVQNYCELKLYFQSYSKEREFSKTELFFKQ